MTHLIFGKRLIFSSIGHSFLCGLLLTSLAAMVPQVLAIETGAKSSGHSQIEAGTKAKTDQTTKRYRALVALRSPKNNSPENEAGKTGSSNSRHEQIFLSWRLLPTDSPTVAFNVYRKIGQQPAEKLNDAVLTSATFFVDTQPSTKEAIYYIQATDSDRVVSVSESVVVSSETKSYLSIPLDLPEGYHANDASVGDLDGDGRLDIVLHVAGIGRDNSQAGQTSPPIFHAYRLDGTRLWTIQLGRNIRGGAHYIPFMVFDLDQDGKAEFVCKTADGTIDGAGETIGDPEADWVIPTRRQETRGGGRRLAADSGKILSGPEYLTVFDGQTGAAVSTVDYLPMRSPDGHSPSPTEQKKIWGDDYGNRIDRFLATVAFLNGKRPSVVMTRGYYTRSVMVAWDFVDRQLVQRWVFDTDLAQPPVDKKQPWGGQGNHSISVADIDGDQCDEIIFGGLVVDHDGTPVYSTGLGHGDSQHTSDLNPHRPGLETWSIHESNRPGPDFVGSELRDTATGEISFVAAKGRDVARGLAADIDPRYPGCEIWGGTRSLYTCEGETIGRCPRMQNMAIWWDGDRLRELLNGVDIYKWDYLESRERQIFTGSADGLASNNGSKANPCLAADILGDWREELIARTADNKELRIYVSPIPTDHRMISLINDRQYRIGVAWQNVGYNQAAHPSFFLSVDQE